MLQAFSKFRHFTKYLKKASHFIKCLKYKYIQINQQQIIQWLAVGLVYGV
jgi:lysozyme family protein